MKRWNFLIFIFGDRDMLHKPFVTFAYVTQRKGKNRLSHKFENWSRKLKESQSLRSFFPLFLYVIFVLQHKRGLRFLTSFLIFHSTMIFDYYLRQISSSCSHFVFYKSSSFSHSFSIYVIWVHCMTNKLKSTTICWS